MTTGINLGSDYDMHGPARASRREQSPGFQLIRIGESLITALYDGFVSVPADDLHGAPPAEIHQLLADHETYWLITKPGPAAARDTIAPPWMCSTPGSAPVLSRGRLM
jgi:hypothetical protein